MLERIAWMFMAYGMLGWVWETTFVSIRHRKLINRGFLRGPFIPIYGFSATTLLLTMDWLSKQIPSDVVHYSILAMVCATVIASAWEYLVSLLMETAFSTRWWDYSHLPFNLNGRIALMPSFFWGIGGFILWQYVQPVLNKGYSRGALQDHPWMLIVLYSLLAVDAGVTLSELIQFRQVMTRLHTLSEDIFDFIADRLEGLEGAMEQRENLAQLLHEAREELRLKANYVRLERISEFNDFTVLIRSKAKTILQGHEHPLEEFGEMLSKIRKHARFYKSFPNAHTKELPYIHVVLRHRKKSP